MTAPGIINKNPEFLPLDILFSLPISDQLLILVTPLNTPVTVG